MVKKEDIDFMPDTYAAEVESTPVAAHAILWVSVVFLVVAIIWANLAKLDEVTHADGRVIPSGQIQVVQNLEGGILAEILVKAGDRVTKNQSLIRMDDTRFASSFNEGILTSQSLRARIARLQAEISGDAFRSPEGFPPEHADIIEDELQLYNSRQRELSSRIDILNQQLTQHRQALAELRAEEKKAHTKCRPCAAGTRPDGTACRNRRSFESRIATLAGCSERIFRQVGGNPADRTQGTSDYRGGSGKDTRATADICKRIKN